MAAQFQMPIPQGPITSVLSMKTKDEREQFLRDIEVAVSPYGVTSETTEYGPRHFVITLKGAGLNANLDADANDPCPLMIHWYGARSFLTPVAGAWKAEDINSAHGCKATSFPSSYIDLVETLVQGFRAAADGTAFRNSPEDIRERIKFLYKELNGDFQNLYQKLEKEYGWTLQQAYIATEFLDRPPSLN